MMTDTELFVWWLGALALSVSGFGVHLGAFLIRRRQRHDPFDLLGAEVRRLNTQRKKKSKQ